MFLVAFFFFFKQKTAYEMRISDWSSDVCSSDLAAVRIRDTLGRIAIRSPAACEWRPSQSPPPCRPLPGEPSYLGIAVEYHRAAGRRISNASFAPAGVQLPGRLSPCALAIDFGKPLIGGHRARGLDMTTAIGRASVREIGCQ